jgi:hypothetical protein
LRSRTQARTWMRVEVRVEDEDVLTMPVQYKKSDAIGRIILQKISHSMHNSC